MTTEKKERRDSPAVRWRKAQAQRLRSALLQKGVAAEVLAAALEAIGPKKERTVRMSKKVKVRILELLAEGSQVVLTKDRRSGIRVYTMDGWKSQTNRKKPHPKPHPTPA